MTERDYSEENLDEFMLKASKILCEEKGNQQERISFNKQRIESVLPPELLKKDKRYIEEYIVDAIKKYSEL